MITKEADPRRFAERLGADRSLGVGGPLITDGTDWRFLDEFKDELRT
jgi:hypothetical protein